jgi:hypothetical protein
MPLIVALALEIFFLGDRDGAEPSLRKEALETV